MFPQAPSLGQVQSSEEEPEKYLHPLEQRLIPAARAAAPNPTGSLWLHLETSHWSCSPGIPGTISRRKTLKTPRPPCTLSTLFSMLGKIRMARDVSPKHCTTHELSSPNQELYSSEYTGKNSKYMIRKEHSSLLSLVECSTTNNCCIEQILSSYGERMVCFTYICCAISGFQKSNINKVH